MQPKPLVAVTWLDAHGGSPEIFSETEIPHEPAVVTTYGLLLREDPQGVSIANEEFEGGLYRGHTFVPSALVVTIRHIRYSQTRRGSRKSISKASPQEPLPAEESPEQSADPAE